MTDPRDTTDGVAGADSGPAPSSPSGRAPLTAATLAAVVAPGLVIFVFPMVSLIARNDEYFGGAYGSGRVLYLAGALTMLVGALTWAVSGTRVGRPLFTGYVLLTPAWIAYSLFGDSSDTVGVVVVGSIVIALVVYLTLRPRPQFLPFLGLLAGLVVVATGAGTAIDVTQAGEASPSSSGVADRASEGDSDLPNIYHMVLDEYQTEMFEAVLDDELRASLGGLHLVPERPDGVGPHRDVDGRRCSVRTNGTSSRPRRDYVEEALLGPTSSLQQLKRPRLRDVPATTTTHPPTGSRARSTTGTSPPTLSNSRPAADYADSGQRRCGSMPTCPGRIAEPLLPAAQWAQLDRRHPAPRRRAVAVGRQLRDLPRSGSPLARHRAATSSCTCSCRTSRTCSHRTASSSPATEDEPRGADGVRDGADGRTPRTPRAPRSPRGLRGRHPGRPRRQLRTRRRRCAQEPRARPVLRGVELGPLHGRCCW